MPDVPVLTVTSIDPVLRDSALATLLLDLPGAVAVRHDITPDGRLQRVVHGWEGVRDRHTQYLDHGCLSCALRADLLPVLRGLIEGPDRPAQIVVGLPVTSEPLPLVHAVRDAGLVPHARSAAVVATLAPETFEHDLFGDDLLAERHLELNPDDRRSVGEALATQLEAADAILLESPAQQRDHDLLDHLTGYHQPRTVITEANAHELLALPRTDDEPRDDVPDTQHAWSLNLHSHKPFHPERLYTELQALGDGPIRARGTFWLPGRPDVVGVWDGAGGQLSIGAAGTWPGEIRTTRLRVTGIGPQRDPVRRAFRRALMTDREMERGLESWEGVDDGFGPWLGVEGAEDTEGSENY